MRLGGIVPPDEWYAGMVTIGRTVFPPWCGTSDGFFRKFAVQLILQGGWLFHDPSQVAFMFREMRGPSDQESNSREGHSMQSPGAGFKNSWPLADLGGNPVVLCSGQEWFSHILRPEASRNFLRTFYRV